MVPRPRKHAVRRTGPVRLVLSVVLWFAPALASAQTVEEAPALARHLERHAAKGVIALFDPSTGLLRVSDRARAQTGFLPASTFKVPAALIALDSGIVSDAHGDVFTYDWKPFLVAACNADQTLASALARSCVPVFAKLGRMIGDERLAAGLKSFGFGNARATGAYPYWLQGDLRISALEQVAFMDKLRRGTLPVSTDAMRTVTRIIELQRSGNFMLRGKTGWHPNPPPGIGWLVGWAEKNGDVRVFALNLDAQGTKPAARLAIVLSVLAEAGLAP